MKRGVNGRRERADGKSFRQPGHAFQEHVAIRQQANQQSINQLSLADNYLANLAAQFANPYRRRLHLFIQACTHQALNLGKEGR
jgi:hypothetical protein